MINDLKVKLFADGADKGDIVAHSRNPLIKGFTTNPTLMRKAGISDYEAFARDVLEAVPDKPISFEVFSDDLAEMAVQARKIASWGANVLVKIPVTNTCRESSADLVRGLAAEGVKLNVTALMTLDQVRTMTSSLADGPAAYVSVFAGRIADTGRDPEPLMAEAVRILADHPQLELIWASPREVFNVVQASRIGCHVITATTDVLAKLSLFGKDLDQYSLETVEMFRRDAVAAAYTI